VVELGARCPVRIGTWGLPPACWFASRRRRLHPSAALVWSWYLEWRVPPSFHTAGRQQLDVVFLGGMRTRGGEDNRGSCGAGIRSPFVPTRRRCAGSRGLGCVVFTAVCSSSVLMWRYPVPSGASYVWSCAHPFLIPSSFTSGWMLRIAWRPCHSLRMRTPRYPSLVHFCTLLPSPGSVRVSPREASRPSSLLAHDTISTLIECGWLKAFRLCFDRVNLRSPCIMVPLPSSWVRSLCSFGT
jgi:hypothetical protein